MRTKCSNIDPDLAAIGPEATVEGGVSDRSELVTRSLSLRDRSEPPPRGTHLAIIGARGGEHLLPQLACAVEVSGILQQQGTDEHGVDERWRTDVRVVHRLA